MKSAKLIALMAIPLFALLTQAVAQTGAARVSVPFQFSVANKTLPAGDYSITVNNGLLQVAAIDGQNAAHTMTVYVGGSPNENLTPRLVFHCYGERRFLAQVWIGEINMGHQLFASAEEVEYARATKQESVTLAAVKVSK